MFFNEIFIFIYFQIRITLHVVKSNNKNEVKIKKKITTRFYTIQISQKKLYEKLHLPSPLIVLLSHCFYIQSKKNPMLLNNIKYRTMLFYCINKWKIDIVTYTYTQTNILTHFIYVSSKNLVFAPLKNLLYEMKTKI